MQKKSKINIIECVIYRFLRLKEEGKKGAIIRNGRNPLQVLLCVCYTQVVSLAWEQTTRRRTTPSNYRCFGMLQGARGILI